VTRSHNLRIEDESSRDLFLDSGAHSLYTKWVMRKKLEKCAKTDQQLENLLKLSSTELAEAEMANPKYFRLTDKEQWEFYRSDVFYEYVDEYASFVKENQDCIPYFANMDAIFNPKISYYNQKYIEKNYGIVPVPVIHAGTPIHWIKKYLKEGYDFLGFGGLGQKMSKKSYFRWADNAFSYICPPPHRTPVVKVHGFAMTSMQLVSRYPWWSVDSASWIKASGFGAIYVPSLVDDEFCLTRHNRPPMILYVSETSTQTCHYDFLGKAQQKRVRRWLAMLGVPFGTPGEGGDRGVINHYAERIEANLRYYRMLQRSQPRWPWRFQVQKENTVFDTQGVYYEDLEQLPLTEEGIRFYYSGMISRRHLPERVLYLGFGESVDMMLTYNDMRLGGEEHRQEKLLSRQEGQREVIQRFKRHKKRKRMQNAS
jgi:hypothetical protein